MNRRSATFALARKGGKGKEWKEASSKVLAGVLGDTIDDPLFSVCSTSPCRSRTLWLPASTTL